MNRRDFQELAEARQKEARALLDNGCYEGAYYLVGYAVECALKACIAKKTCRYDFPPEPREVSKIYTHNLNGLLDFAGLSQELEKEKDAGSDVWINWGLVKDWSEGLRYEVSVPERRARDVYGAVADARNGVLVWLKKWW